MRIFLVVICSLALACVAGAQEQNQPNKPGQKKKATQARQVSQPPRKAVGKPATAGKPTTTGKPTATGKPTTTGKPTEFGKPTRVAKGKATGKPTEVGKATGAGKAKATGGPTEVSKPAKVGKAAGAGKAEATAKPTEVTKAAGAAKRTTAGKATATGKPFKAQKFNLPTKTTPTKVASVNFQQGKRIQGSQNWQGQRYTVFRNYTPQWHDQGWWRGHYNRVVFAYGGWYYWNAGFWFPAWGYAPNAYYAYDGPIYGYNNLPPDQVIANVQSALQQQGYYQGEVDGLLGPQTREAIAGYQRDHGLYETAAVDQPTLQSLGMA
ncbi:MAG TPA: peptidoglycan-binding protein [Candidatus Udaeobacter sp.]